ncbi:MAG: YbhB/YbcL family Raf kinase inhibitor-like protein [Acetobacteraceae bacterium]|jgi:Raf kinase inhibitor-like YbhB/YbcL family protein|nr:YbhB/YbcL family Raf kinase inhibitor-like protein [Acetobacteraceae bacterium]
MAFVLKSPAFSHGEEMPTRYTCEGANVSPPLEWSGAPPGTRSFALVMEDLDAPSGPFRHWALYDIMADRTLLPEGVGRGVKTEALGHGVNDYGHPRYDGPCPSERDDAHRYRFRLAALDLETPLATPKEPAGDLWDTIRPYILAEAELIGSYTSRHKRD